MEILSNASSLHLDNEQYSKWWLPCLLGIHWRHAAPSADHHTCIAWVKINLYCFQSQKSWDYMLPQHNQLFLTDIGSWHNWLPQDHTARKCQCLSPSLISAKVTSPSTISQLASWVYCLENKTTFSQEPKYKPKCNLSDLSLISSILVK